MNYMRAQCLSYMKRDFKATLYNGICSLLNYGSVLHLMPFDHNCPLGLNLDLADCLCVNDKREKCITRKEESGESHGSRGLR